MGRSGTRLGRSINYSFSKGRQLISESEFVDQKFDEKKHDIKQFLARSIGKKIRKIPEIKFIVDSTEHEASRINKILSNLDIPPKK